MPKKLTILLIIVVVAAGAGYFYVRSGGYKKRVENQASSSQSTEFNKKQYSLTDPNSIWIIVNKNRALPSNFVPADLTTVNVPKRTDKLKEELQLRAEAAKHMEDLVNAAKSAGINLVLGSGYRSYQLQQFYNSNYAAQSGQAEADKFSAQPGKSEHQTGLAADLAPASGNCYLDICFADTPEGKWLVANSYKYGFILRYQKGKEALTGYQYEPWHIRYVGVDLANEIYKTGQTLEQFFGIQ